MTKPTGGRGRQKWLTPSRIRRTARRLFAERGFDAVTIADVAAAADVSVQTVYNHFDTKESLFFEGRDAWVNGPAESVRLRPVQTPPLAALREHWSRPFTTILEWSATPEGRSFIVAVAASAALRAHGRT